MASKIKELNQERYDEICELRRIFFSQPRIICQHCGFEYIERFNHLSCPNCNKCQPDFEKKVFDPFSVPMTVKGF